MPFDVNPFLLWNILSIYLECVISTVLDSPAKCSVNSTICSQMMPKPNEHYFWKFQLLHTILWTELEFAFVPRSWNQYKYILLLFDGKNLTALLPEPLTSFSIDFVVCFCTYLPCRNTMCGRCRSQLSALCSFLGRHGRLIAHLSEVRQHPDVRW